MILQDQVAVKLPNFLIVGQAKCGTSSLSEYLRQHPEVFLSHKKEPRFLSSQHMNRPLGGPFDAKVEEWYVKDFKSYAALFQQANAPAIGEASADTLYFYEHTISTIKKYLGDPKILIILRDPVKRAFSAWQHLMRDGRESFPFAQALGLEESRKQNNWELIYHYTSASYYHDAVKAFIGSFSQVKVLLCEELARQPEQVMREVFSFLGVDPSIEVNTGVQYNMSGIPRNRLMHEVLTQEHPVRKIARIFTRTLLTHEQRESLTIKLKQQNLVRQQLPQKQAHQLRKLFLADIEKLEALLQRDLSEWKN